MAKPYNPCDLEPLPNAEKRMWSLASQLFPMHRSLVGPGFRASLEVIRDTIPLEFVDVPSGTEFFGWTVPDEFSINDVRVVHESGQEFLKSDDNHYHVWSHSAPFRGRLSREELVEHISVHPVLDDAIPLKVTYYRDKMGLSASKNQVDMLPQGNYDVIVDVENKPGNLTYGEIVLPGTTDKEIIISSYLCHPHGANDNLSGIVVLTELYRALSQVESRRFTYRFVIWPETIGAISFLAKNRDRTENILGGISCMIVGDDGPFFLKRSRLGTSLLDKAAEYALSHSAQAYAIHDYIHDGSDERQFNLASVGIPYIVISRGYTNYAEYHTSVDDMSFISSENLLNSLKVYCDTIGALERAIVFKPTYFVEPFLSGYGIYPYDLGAGEGRRDDRAAQPDAKAMPDQDLTFWAVPSVGHEKAEASHLKLPGMANWLQIAGLYQAGPETRNTPGLRRQHAQQFGAAPGHFDRPLIVAGIDNADDKGR